MRINIKLNDPIYEEDLPRSKSSDHGLSDYLDQTLEIKITDDDGTAYEGSLLLSDFLASEIPEKRAVHKSSSPISDGSNEVVSSSIEVDSLRTASTNQFWKSLVRLTSEEALQNILANSSKKELIIESNTDLVSNYPWSFFLFDKFGIKTIQKRIIESKQLNEDIQQKNKGDILICLSHSRTNINGDKLHRIADDFSTEIIPILESNLNDTSYSLEKPQFYTVSRFINRNSLMKTNLKNYDILHLVMHGENGCLGFEKNDAQWDIDWLTSSEFINLLPGDHQFKIIFLSLCDGAKGSEKEDSLAYRLIDSGKAECVIAYTGKIESKKAAPSFTNNFYKYYLEEKCSIEISFEKSVQEFFYSDNNYWDKPILYMKGKHE